MNASVVTNLTDLYDITSFLKQAALFEGISFHWVCMSSLHFMLTSKNIFMLCSHSIPNFKVSYMMNH